jgi:hypothetical protein
MKSGSGPSPSGPDCSQTIIPRHGESMKQGLPQPETRKKRASRRAQIQKAKRLRNRPRGPANPPAPVRGAPRLQFRILTGGSAPGSTFFGRCLDQRRNILGKDRQPVASEAVSAVL